MFETKSPFERLRSLLEGVEPGAPPIDLTVGGPRHAPPAFVSSVIAANADAFLHYPPIAGTPDFKRAVRGYLARRYGVGDWFDGAGLTLPISGSREGLFFAALAARDHLGKDNPALLFANPFYQTYPAAAHAIRAEAVPLAAAHAGAVLPDWDLVPAETLDRAVAYYVASPTNPQGDVASLADWHALIDRAERHNFILFADECYADVYREADGPPTGVFDALAERPESIEHVAYFHSLSKRSNLAGMRAGFVAGGAGFLGTMRDFRNQAAPQVPGPLQAAAAACYEEETHVVENRRLYDEKFEIAEAMLAPVFGSVCNRVAPAAGFFMWLPFHRIGFGDDDEATARLLWREAGVRAVPGSYLALTPTGQQNPGRGYIRLALVADATVTREALGRVVSVAERGQAREHVAFTGAGGGAF